MSNTIETIIQAKRGTTEEWEANLDYVPAEGEPCLDLTTGKVKWGDGVTTYGNLKVAGANAEHYEGTKQDGETDEDVFDRVLTEAGATAQKDDIFIVKTPITADKYTCTAYVYNGDAWTAMDGNYSADNVFFDENMTVTTTVGTITELENGSATFETAGKSLTQVLNALLAEEKDPEVDEPSVTFTTGNQNGEVGTAYTLPTATFKVTDVGSYTYGSKDANGTAYAAEETGVTFAAGDVTITQGSNTKNNENALVKDSTLALTATATGETLFTDDAIKYTFSASAEYTESDRVPVTNLGNKVDGLKIESASVEVSDCTATMTGWRKMFMGAVTDATAAITSDVIRGLSLVSKKLDTAAQTFTVPVGTAKIIVACPSGYTISKVEYFTMSWEEFSGFTQGDSVDVADARGGSNGLKAYNVFTYTPASAFEAATQYRVTLKKA